jgi:hypothetical protein
VIRNLPGERIQCELVSEQRHEVEAPRADRLQPENGGVPAVDEPPDLIVRMGSPWLVEDGPAQSICGCSMHRPRPGNDRRRRSSVFSSRAPLRSLLRWGDFYVELSSDDCFDVGPGDRRPPGTGDVLAAGVRRVDDSHDDPMVVEHRQLLGGAAPDEARVLADHNLGEAVLFPERASVEKSITGDPRPTRLRIVVKPRQALPRLGIEEAARPAQIGARLFELGDLVRKPMWRVPVVVVPVGDQRTRASSQPRFRFAPRTSRSGNSR